MRLRPYRKSDARAIMNWIVDERTHALWCGNLLPFPFTEKDFNEYLEETEERWGNSSFTAVRDDGPPRRVSPDGNKSCPEQRIFRICYRRCRGTGKRLWKRNAASGCKICF